MLIDPAASIGAVRRTVLTTDRDGRPAKVVVAERTFPTSVEDLWDALTTAERIPRWFLPISGDLRVGGRYQLEGHAGGEVLACEPPTRFEITWGTGDDVSWVTVVLSDAGDDRAHLELRHVAHPPDGFWDEYGPGAVGIGWDQLLLGLDLHTATGETVDPGEYAAWSPSAEGLAFVEGASGAWCDASIADGTDADAARAARDRVTAFYTGG